MEEIVEKKVRKTTKKSTKAQEFLGTGRRKCSVARVRIAVGTGKITINEQDIDFEEYVHNTFASYKEFFVSCASLNRDSVRVEGKEVYKNYFFRPKSDDKREVLLRGDIEISANGGCFKVLDIYVTK